MARILLVEDDSNLREIYGARLEAEGFEIISANDGEEALSIAVREKPDLIISDVMMPKISGFDMLDILRTTPETKDVKIIMMTALGQDEDRKRGADLGADHYIVKSQVTLDDVVGIVQEVLGGAPATPTAAASTDDVTAPTNPSSIEGAAMPPSPADPTTTNQTTIQSQVQDFVDSSPLMNGTPPQSAQPQPPQNPTPPPATDQPPQQTL